MSLIQTALKAIDFHMYDRQGRELIGWPRDQQHTPDQSAARVSSAAAHES